MAVKHLSSGWSLIEAMIAMAIFALVAVALISLSAGSLNPWLGRGASNQAEALAAEGLEAARVIKDRAWNEFVFAKSALSLTGTTWSLVGENTEETIGDYTRYLEFADVCRNAQDQIAPCPATRVDPHIKAVTVTVKWGVAPLVKQIAKTVYLANWDSHFWEQADWSGGDGQAIWGASNKYWTAQNIDSSVSGQISLSKQGAICQPFSWTFDNPADYVYDQQKIEIVNGVAKLKQARQYTLSDTSINSAVFTTASLNDFPSAVNVANNVTISGITGLVNVYAMTHRFGASCEVITMAITADGLIRNPRLNSLTYETNNCDNPSIFRVNNNVFGLVHIQGAVRTGYLRTLTIDNNGVISLPIDSFAFTPNQTSFPAIAKTFNKIYALVFNRANVGQLATIKINDSGIIVHSLVSQRSLVANAQYPAVSQWSATASNAVIAVNYSAPAEAKDYVKTFTLDLRGLINPAFNQYSVAAASLADRTSFLKLSSPLAVFSFIDNNGAATLQTLSLQDNGVINQTAVDTFAVANGVRRATLNWAPGLPGNLLLMDYDSGSAGYISLLSVDLASGLINKQILDTFNFSLDFKAAYHYVFSLDSMHAAVAFRQPDTLGLVSTLAIQEGALVYAKNAVIYPKNFYSPPAVDAWLGFKETATKNNGSINYQLSDNQAGPTWSYWNNTLWSATAGDTPNSGAAVVDDKIPMYSAGAKSLGFKAVLQGDGTQTVELDRIDLACGNLQLEIGSLSANQNWQSVKLLNTYADPVVVASHWRQANTKPASVRLRNVTNNSLEIRLQNPSDSALANDQITYLVMEAGVWNVAGLRAEAGHYNTATVGSYQNWAYDVKMFRSAPYLFATDPIVLHQVMSSNDNAWITSYVGHSKLRTSAPTTAGMRIALNGAEARASHGAEDIGWIALERDRTGQLGGINLETYRTPNSVRGYDDGCYNFTYRNSYTAPPLTLSSQQNMNEADGSWANVCSNTSAQAGLQVDEDQVLDQERSNAGEILGFISFARPTNYFSSAGNSYNTTGYLISSAFRAGDSPKTQVVEWSQSLPSAASNVKFQVRTADEVAGAPANWSEWFGALGANSYFTNYQGTLIDKSLNDHPWAQYRAELNGNGQETPLLNKVKVNYK